MKKFIGFIEGVTFVTLIGIFIANLTADKEIVDDMFNSAMKNITKN